MRFFKMCQADFLWQGILIRITRLPVGGIAGEAKSSGYPVNSLLRWGIKEGKHGYAKF